VTAISILPLPGMGGCRQDAGGPRGRCCELVCSRPFSSAPHREQHLPWTDSEHPHSPQSLYRVRMLRSSRLLCLRLMDMLQVRAFSELIPLDETPRASLSEHAGLYSEHTDQFWSLLLKRSEHNHVPTSTTPSRMLRNRDRLSSRNRYLLQVQLGSEHPLKGRSSGRRDLEHTRSAESALREAREARTMAAKLHCIERGSYIEAT
jgi:hypothetical protein